MTVKTIKEAIIASKSILESVIPELEGIAEYSKNELHKAKTILSEGLELFGEKPNADLIIHIVQYEHRGIPDDPFVTIDPEKAFDKYQELLVNQGFRSIQPDESIADFGISYQNALSKQSSNESNQYPDLDTNDTVRWWDLNIE
ncbi:MAG: hypothetical protein ABJF65_00300 [Reichenbachiella sp.]|uniref:hypothetical protein n=1 Tax=Reichenbachiella sp. TaxID=2184521 RepID=UPI0032676358